MCVEQQQQQQATSNKQQATSNKQQATNQQRNFVAAPFSVRIFLGGILDGHCGGQCASHVANAFPKILHDAWDESSIVVFDAVGFV